MIKSWDKTTRGLTQTSQILIAVAASALILSTGGAGLWRLVRLKVGRGEMVAGSVARDVFSHYLDWRDLCYQGFHE